jgi:cyclic lactone autoinducer peptide
MKKIVNPCLKILSKAVSSIVLFSVSMAAGTISWFGNYEPEMPAALVPREDEEA